MRTSDYIELEEQYGAHNYYPLDVVIARGEGVWVYDVDGNRYLECLSAYSALNQGHLHPRILEALINQARKVTLTSRAFRNDQLPLLYQELSEMTGFEMAVNSMMETSIPGIFAAGDVTCTEIRQVVVAASQGCLAALAAEKYLYKRTRYQMDWAK